VARRAAAATVASSAWSGPCPRGSPARGARSGPPCRGGGGARGRGGRMAEWLSHTSHFARTAIFSRDERRRDGCALGGRGWARLGDMGGAVRPRSPQVARRDKLAAHLKFAQAPISPRFLSPSGVTQGYRDRRRCLHRQGGLLNYRWPAAAAVPWVAAPSRWREARVPGSSVVGLFPENSAGSRRASAVLRLPTPAQRQAADGSD